MMRHLMEQTGKSLWHQLYTLAIKKAVETVVVEGIKASIDVARRRVIKIEFHKLNKQFEREAAQDKASAKTPASDETISEGVEPAAPDAGLDVEAPSELVPKPYPRFQRSTRISS